MNDLHFPPRRIFPWLAIGLSLVFVSLACGAGAPSLSATEPPQVVSTQVQSLETSLPAPSPTQEFLIPDTGGGGTSSPNEVPAIPERRRLTLEFPPQIRAGDSDLIRLTLELDELGNITPTAVTGGNVVTGEVIEIPNLYESHYVIAEARLDIAGMEVSPPELTSQTLSQGQSVSFFWSVLPRETGVYRGTVWLYLRFVDKVSGEESRRAVSAQIIEIEAVKFFGFSGGLARFIGAAGSVIGTVVGFPFFEDIIRFLVGYRKARRAKSLG